MSLPKTSVNAVDLDELERELRGITASTSPRASSQRPVQAPGRTTGEAQTDDPLAELARIVGRDRTLRAVPGGLDASGRAPPVRMSVMRAAFDGPQPANSPGTQGELDLPPAFAPRAGQADAAPTYDTDAYGRDEPLFDEPFADDLAAPGAEVEAEAEAPYDDALYADEASGELDPDEVPAMPAAARLPGRRRVASSRSLAIAIPVILVGLGVGAALVLRAMPGHSAPGAVPVIKADETPVKVKPVKVAGGEQTPSQTALDAAAPSTKPSQIVVARPEQPVDVVAAAKAGQSAPPSGQPPASTGIVIIDSPPAGAAPAAPAAPGAAPTTPAPVATNPPAPAVVPAPAPVVAAPAPAAPPAPVAADPSPQPLPTAAVNVPLPEPPRATTPNSVFGTPRRVATLAVKPDGTMAPASAPPAPKPVARTTDPSADTPAGTTPPAAKKPDDTTRSHPAKVKEAAKDQDAPPSHRSHEVGAPLSIIAAARRGRPVVASAEPAQAPKAATEATAPAGGSFAIQVASSLSEKDAKLTLERMRKQFPGLLDSGSIHRADLGSRGIFYRVQVGGMSRDAAEKACARLKAGGGRCILTRG